FLGGRVVGGPGAQLHGGARRGEVDLDGLDRLGLTEVDKDAHAVLEAAEVGVALVVVRLPDGSRVAVHHVAYFAQFGAVSLRVDDADLVRRQRDRGRLAGRRAGAGAAAGGRGRHGRVAGAAAMRNESGGDQQADRGQEDQGDHAEDEL